MDRIFETFFLFDNESLKIQVLNNQLKMIARSTKGYKKFIVSI